jgi:hypothetical protein
LGRGVEGSKWRGQVNLPRIKLGETLMQKLYEKKMKKHINIIKIKAKMHLETIKMAFISFFIIY